MGNYLQMAKRQQVLALLELGWSFRRIEAETGVRRETISRYDAARRANAAKVFPGSELLATASAEASMPITASNAAKVLPDSRTGVTARARPRASAAVHRAVIAEKLDAGLSVQRIWQDLVEEFGYSASYESVKR